jgi:hypothetical protein
MTETAPYSVMKKTGDIEYRKYPALLVATAPGGSDNEMFRPLFAYITGKNRSGSKIAMTAPVITHEKIPMTTPVISAGGTMSFVMPARFSRETLPEPMDPRISIEEVPAREVAVIRFSGVADTETVRRMTDLLLSQLRKDGIEPLGAPFLMRYNAPFVPGFLRRNEVGVEIRTGGTAQ